MGEGWLQIEQAARRLIFDESRNDVDGCFQSGGAADACHRSVHGGVEPPVLTFSQRIDQVFFGNEIAIDGRPGHPGQRCDVGQRQLPGARPEHESLGSIEDPIGQIAVI